MDFVDLKFQQRKIRANLDGRIAAVLDHGQYIMGPEVGELEQRLAEFVGVKHCITVASGTEALLISLMSLDIGPGDEVVTTPFSFIATAEVIVLLGAKPVFVDIEPGTCNIDATAIAGKITERTKAIMPVSLYGQPADMDAINDIATRHGGIPVIEDAAQSFGATYKGRSSGALSNIGCTSFFPSKPLGCYGDGGAIFTDDDVLATACREIRVHGQSARYKHTRIGVGGRMDTLQCAVLLAKLEIFEDELRARAEMATRYDEAFDQQGVRHIAVQEGRTSAYAQYTVMLDNRDEVQARLSKEGIPSTVHYPRCINQQPAYAHLCCPDCTPAAVAAAGRVLSLPISAGMTVETQDRIIRSVVGA